MNDEGQFRFTNGIVIDTDLKFDRVNSVVNHEFIHSQLYSMTTYGQIVLMLEKNSLFHNKSKEFQEVLFGYIKRMQERTAVNVEIMLECIENGLDAYNDAIAKLQQKNRSYYNYFRKLCCINGKINSEDSAEELADILMRIAVFALNVNPELIPLDELDDAKSLKVYFDNPKNNALISPNRRFDILVNTIFRKNDNNSDIESVIKGSINLEEMENYDYIHNLAFQKVSKILIKSPIASRLIARIATVGTESFAIKKGMDYLNVKPAKINTIKEVFNIPVECKEEFIKLLNKQKHKELFVMHSLGGFEDWHVICIYERKGDKNISYSIFVDDNDFFD